MQKANRNVRRTARHSHQSKVVRPELLPVYESALRLCPGLADDNSTLRDDFLGYHETEVTLSTGLASVAWAADGFRVHALGPMVRPRVLEEVENQVIYANGTQCEAALVVSPDWLAELQLLVETSGPGTLLFFTSVGLWGGVIDQPLTVETYDTDPSRTGSPVVFDMGENAVRADHLLEALRFVLPDDCGESTLLCAGGLLMIAGELWFDDPGFRQAVLATWRGPECTRPLPVAATTKALRTPFTGSTEAWLDTLPFPLASIGWRAYAASSSSLARAHWLEFFEAMAQFVAIVLLSAFDVASSGGEEVRGLVARCVAQNKHTFETAQFGLWLRVIECLSKQGRKLRMDLDAAGRSGDTFRTDQDRILQPLLSKQLIEILASANKLRNRGAHAGAATTRASEMRQIHELRELVNDVRELFGDGWRYYELIQPTVATYGGGEYECEVLQLMGPRVPFRQKSVRLREPLERGCLYLHDPEGDSALKLYPLLRVTDQEGTGRYACAFYNRRVGSKIDWVSYHDPTASVEAEYSPATEEFLGLFA